MESDESKLQAVRKIEQFSFCRIRSSPVHGVGVFAYRAISQGQKILYDDHKSFYTLPYLFLKAHADPKVLDLVIDYVGSSKEGIVAIPEGGFDTLSLHYFVNHSDEPNIKFTSIGVCYIALRDIPEGEELLSDYRTTISEYDRYDVAKRIGRDLLA